METRTVFDRELAKIIGDLTALGEAVADAVGDALNHLEKDDREASRRLVAWDERVNTRRYALEQAALTLIATQQPVATDTRRIAAVIEIAGELERIGDYAKGIASIHLKLNGVAIEAPLLERLREMAVIGQGMLRQSMEAFEARDADAARALVSVDDEVDELFNTVFSSVLTSALPERENLERANYVLWIAHNLERVADRVVNICQRTVFTETGSLEAYAIG